jgi:hypothetical protein
MYFFVIFNCSPKQSFAYSSANCSTVDPTETTICIMTNKYSCIGLYKKKHYEIKLIKGLNCRNGDYTEFYVNNNNYSSEVQSSQKQNGNPLIRR